jgi:hypothetical protein
MALEISLQSKECHMFLHTCAEAQRHGKKEVWEKEKK